MGDYSMLDRHSKQNIFLECTPFCIELEQDTTHNRLHAHEFHQLTIITRGTGELYVNGITQSLREGDVYVIGSYSTHYLRKQKQLEIINICFSMDELLACSNSLQEIKGFRSLFILQPALVDTGRLSSVLHLDYEGMQYVAFITKRLLREVASPASGSEIIIQSYFMILIVFFARACEQNDRILDDEENLCSAIAFINENYDRDIVMSDIVEASLLSGYRLTGAFKQRHGCTPLAYLNKIRIKRACHELKYSKKTISEIAYSVGFKDSNYFSRKFKQLKGVSPREYRAGKDGGDYEDNIF